MWSCLACCDVPGKGDKSLGMLKSELLALPEESMNVGDVLKQGKARCVDVWCGGWLLSRWFGGGDWERVEGRI